MNRDQIIAKTLVDMGLSETSSENCGSDIPYIRDVFSPEMLKRLPESDIVTCEELQLGVECCSTCHGFYPHYEMELKVLPDGRAGWICCAVRRALFPETAITPDSPAALALKYLFGDDES